MKVEEKWIKPKVSKIKIRMEINEIEKQYRYINETKAGSLRKLIIDKPLYNMNREKRALVGIIQTFRG